MNLLDLIGKPANLSIFAFRDAARSEPVAEPSRFEVQYNPSSLEIQHENIFQSGQASPSSSSQARFAHGKSRLVTCMLVLNSVDLGRYQPGSILPSKGTSVKDSVQLFLRLCHQTNDVTHEPSFLRLIFDNGVFGPNFDCRLKSVDLTYLGFDDDGSPLHAELAVQFVEDLSPRKKAALDNFSSPDLTHRRVVKAGDTLPLLCREIYGTPHLYLEVAAANNLDNFRVLAPGQELYFPPLVKPISE